MMSADGSQDLVRQAIADRLARFAPIEVSAQVGARVLRFSYRTAGSGRPLILLHGIGGGSGAWLHQYESLADTFQVIGWDAPGYGRSVDLTSTAPASAHYAQALLAFLDALASDRVDGRAGDRAIIVGQSLGAIIATAFAAAYPSRVAGLVLLDPARGYGAASEAERSERLRTRLESFDRLGAERLADERSGNLLCQQPTPEAFEIVRRGMAALRRDGHARAARLLTSSDILGDAAKFAGPTLVACGSADTVTPEAGARAIAAAFPNAEYQTMPGLGHACYADGPDQVNALLRRFATTVTA